MTILMKNNYRSYMPVLRFLLGLVLLAGWSCKSTEPTPVIVDTPLVMKSSTDSLVLNQRRSNNTALEFTWTTGSNKGTGAAISYQLQLDKKDNRFAAPVKTDMGKVTYSKKYTEAELNELLVGQLKLAPGTPAEIQARIVAVVSDNSVVPDTTQPVTIRVTPYTPVSQTLYLLGDAAPNGWDNAKATPLTADANDATTFVYQGLLKAGEFKFITKLGEWLPAYQKGTDGKLVLRTGSDQPDDKFTIAKTGSYTVTVNLVDLTIVIKELAAPPYSRLWIVGDATPNGWNIDAPNEMRRDPSDPFVFTYNEVLKAGDFKIPTATGNWGGDFYMPLVNNQPFTERGVKLVTGGNPDNKWKVTKAGPYKITLNLRDLTIDIKEFTPYSKLWMVGDATPNGWNIDAPTEMTADVANPYVFTYTGALKAGEFKIPTTTGNWGCDYFMPGVNNPDLSSTVARFTPAGNPDYKWKIATPGNYKITLDQLRETIRIEKL